MFNAILAVKLAAFFRAVVRKHSGLWKLFLIVARFLKSGLEEKGYR